MGIAAGCVCADGILLAAGIALTDASEKWPQRCFFEHAAPNYRFALTGAGNSDLVRMSFDQLSRELDDDDELQDICERTEKAVNRFAKKYLFCYEPGDARRPEVELLIGVRMHDGECVLLKSDENRVCRVDGCVFIGPGSALATTVASWLYEPGLKSAVVSKLMAQILCWARQQGAECGAAARVMTLSAEASAQDTSVVRADEFFWGVQASLRPILTGCLDPSVSDVEFDDRLRWFEEKMSAVRQALRDGEPAEPAAAPRKGPAEYD